MNNKEQQRTTKNNKEQQRKTKNNKEQQRTTKNKAMTTTTKKSTSRAAFAELLEDRRVARSEIQNGHNQF